MKRPAFQFYPGDWLNDASLRMCSVGARGLWIEMLCLMHQGSPYGHLKVNLKAITIPQLGRIVGANEGELQQWIGELEEAGVFSRNEAGEIYSRRMVKDEELRAIRSAGGKEGGNPALVGEYNEPGFVYAMQRSSDNAVKIGISKHPAKRAYKIRQQYPSDVITVLGQKFTEDMGAAEAFLHALFVSKKSGEWFDLDQDELGVLLDLHLKVNPKASSTPSSSSSSSSSKDIPPNPQGGNGDGKRKRKQDDTPYQEILESFQTHLPMLPQPQDPSEWTSDRKAKVRARHNEKRDKKDFWSRYFAYVAKSKFLTGQTVEEFEATFDWLIKPANMQKVIEQNYHKDHDHG